MTQMKERNTNLHQKILSICQDMIYTCSRGKCRTPKHVDLSLTIHQLEQSKDAVLLINKNGHEISYEEKERIDTSWAKYQQKVTVPSNSKRGLTLRAAGDNFHRATESLDGKQLDIVNMVLYQTDGNNNNKQGGFAPNPRPSVRRKGKTRTSSNARDTKSNIGNTIAETNVEIPIKSRFVLLLCLPLYQYSLAYPRRHKIAKNIRHDTKAKDHPCRHSLDVQNRLFPVTVSLNDILHDIQDTKVYIRESKDGKTIFRITGRGKFTIFKISALCGEEVLYDMSLVLEYFSKELIQLGGQFKKLQSNLVLEIDNTLKSLLDRTISHMRDAVISLRPTSEDPFTAVKSVHKVTGKDTWTGKLLKKYVKTILDLEHFIQASLSVINLK
ncbi:uncharacterized protein LOC123547898 [Mercenaria mercenaria]|uniref:uncharacterized protein LOC123547898 n=1 Tax=Mercenaria mercenaria TaxID=6596 RepID=UPI00234EF543|nr:uncharacterized protein LOC123547898 [Mercenaria mercenaria]